MTRRQIDVSTSLVMIFGAALSVYVEITQKAASPAMSMGGTTSIWGWEIWLFGLVGAAPGWFANGLLKCWYFPNTHGEQETRQPRCRHCGAVLAQAGLRCDDCKGF